MLRRKRGCASSAIRLKTSGCRGLLLGKSRKTPLVAAALEKKVMLEFHGQSLNQVVALLALKTNEPCLLDPSARRGAIKPQTQLSGSAANEPLSSALPRWLKPLGMTYVIRDEAVILTTAH